MKITKSFLKTACTMYLYSDQHAVVIHTKRDPKAGDVSWATIHENVGLGVIIPNGVGRIIVSDASAIAMVLKADSIRVRTPSVEDGSISSKGLNLVVGTVALDFGCGEFHIYNLPNVLISSIYYDTRAADERWSIVKSLRTWGSLVVSDVYPVKEAA